MDDFSRFAYETLPEPSTMGSFLITASATIFGGFLLILFRPFLASWARSVKRWYDKNRAQEKEAWAYFLARLRSPNTEEQEHSRTVALRYFRNVLISIFIIAVLLGLMLGVARPILDKNIEQSHSVILSAIKENLAIHDKMASQLIQQTGNRIGPKSFCEQSEQDLERTRAEVLCKRVVQAELARDCEERRKYDVLAIQQYGTCMLERGWIVSPCEESDVDCVEIWTSAPNCKTQRWKTSPDYIGRECSSYVPYDEMVALAEYECLLRAEKFAYVSLYQGYKELYRLWNTAREYELCMLEKGWRTRKCQEVDEAENACRTIFFPESQCRMQIRDWVEADDRDFDNVPCKGEY